LKPNVSVIGCGFVGLCLAVILAKIGLRVFAVDTDKNKINKLKDGQPPFYELGLKELLLEVLDGNLEVTSDTDYAIKNSEITFVTVGTPTLPNGNTNLEFVKSAIKNIAKSLSDKKGYHTIVIKSTVLPTTTNSILKPILENESKKIVGRDIGLVMNPEFLREGSAIQDTKHPHLIVIGSNDKKSADVLESFYRDVYGKELPQITRTSIENAEMIKYANNAFLATKISYINTIANICQKIPNTDVETVAKAIGKDPRIGQLFLQAGPGYGGSCFPKDVSALINFSKKIGFEPLLLEATKEVNEIQVNKVVELIREHLGSLKGKTITVLGLSFKKDTDDIRESVSIKLIEKLLKNHAIVRAHDPMALKNTEKIFGNKVFFYNSPAESLKGTQCAVIMTDWPVYRHLGQKIIGKMKKPVIIDTKRVLKNQNYSKAKIISLGVN